MFIHEPCSHRYKNMGSQRCKSLCSTWSEERSNHCKSTSSPQNQGLFLQQTCAACAAVSLYLLRMFLHNWKAYHFPVYQDIARKSFCPRVHLHLRFVNLGPVRSVWPTKKKCAWEGSLGCGLRFVLSRTRHDFAVARAEKCKGCPHTCSDMEPPIPSVAECRNCAFFLLGNLQIDIQISRRRPYRHAGVGCRPPV